MSLKRDSIVVVLSARLMVRDHVPRICDMNKDLWCQKPDREGGLLSHHALPDGGDSDTALLGISAVLPENRNSVIDDPAVFQSHNPIAVGSVGFGVRHLNNGCAFIVKAFEQIHNLFALGRMQVARRLVGENQTRVRDYCARDADQLLLSAGKLSRIQILLTDDLKSIERVADDRFAILAAHVSIRERQFEIFEHSLIVQQVIALKDEADVLVTKFRALLRL